MHSDCKHFMESWDRHRNNRLPESETAAVTRHLSTCDECAARFNAVEGIAAAVRAMEMDPFTKRRIVVAAANFRRPQKVRPWRRIPRKPVLAFVGMAALALVGFAALIWMPGVKPAADFGIPVGAAQPVSRTIPTPAETTLAYFEKGDRREIVLFPGTSLYLSDDAVIDPISVTSTFAHFSLTGGRVVAEIGAHEADFRFVITLPHGELEARGTVFSVSCADDGSSETRVSEGLVEMRAGASLESILVPAGDAVILKDNRLTRRGISDAERRADRCLIDGCVRAPERTDTVAAADHHTATAAAKMASALKQGRLDEASKLVDDVASDTADRISTVRLLARLARAYRSAKMFNEAKNVYLRLINAYPQTDTAKDSLVALGQIEYRTLGLPGEALLHFDRYLEENPDGFLAETARAERIRVLEAGGRYREVIVAADEYIGRHRNSFGLSEVKRRRADALAKTGHCREALDEFRHIIQEWPGTMEAKRAEKGLSSCD